MSYAGYYINLDRSAQRRAQVEEQIGRLGLGDIYRRFPAVDGNSLNFPNKKLKDGEMGCFISHYLVLKENLEQPRPLHVIEDDVLLAGCMEQTIRWLVENNGFGEFDLIYTDTSIPPANTYYKSYKTLFDKVVTFNETGRVTQAAFQLIDMQDRQFGTTSSFLVNPGSIRKLHDLYGAELARGPALPIDIFLLEKVRDKVLKVGCLFPFVTSVRLEHCLSTTIDERYSQLPMLATGIARHSFYIDRDLDECRRYIKEYLPLPADPHLHLLKDVLRFSFTDRFVDI